MTVRISFFGEITGSNVTKFIENEVNYNLSYRTSFYYLHIHKYLFYKTAAQMRDGAPC